MSGNADTNNILEIIKKVAIDGRLRDDFYYMLEDGVNITVDDVNRVRESLSQQSLNVEGTDIMEAARIMKDSLQMNKQNGKFQLEEQKPSFLVDIKEFLDILVIDNNKVMVALRKITANSKLYAEIMSHSLKKDGIEEINKILSNESIIISSSELLEVIRVLLNLQKLKEQKERLETGEIMVKEAFLNGMVEDLKGIKKSYDHVMVMYIIAFYLGVLLMLAAIYSAVVLKEDFLTLVLGGVGGADILGSLLFKPAQKLQDSRVSLVKLKAAYFSWINELNNWNTNLYKHWKKGPLRFSEMTESSKIMVENLQSILRLTKESDSNNNNNNNNNGETKSKTSE